MYFHGTSSKEKFKEYDCPMRYRIGRLMDTSDVWYDLNNEKLFSSVYEELETDLKSFVLPYLNRVNSKKDILNLFLESKVHGYNPIAMIKVLFSNDYKKEALRMLEEELNSSTDTTWKSRYLSLKEELHKVL